MTYYTNIWFLRLKQGITADDRHDGPLKPVFDALEDTSIHAQGFYNQYWGFQEEDPSVMVIIANFEKPQDHERWVQSDIHKKQVPGMMEAYDLEEFPVGCFVQFTSDAQIVCEAPVTEITFYHVPEPADQQRKTTLEAQTRGLGEAAVQSGLCLDFASGWATSEVEFATSPTGKALSYTSLFGWGALENHGKAQQVPEIGAAFSPLLNTILPPLDPPEIGKSMCHVKLTKIAKK